MDVIFNHMVECIETTSLDDVMVALADPTRRDILSRLRSGAQRVTGLADAYPISLNAVSKHVKTLERAGLIRREIVGREHWCSLDARPLADVGRFAASYAEFWSEALDRLEERLQHATDHQHSGGEGP
ncbi:MAG: metalloregulator ArsR/SmtB family transcription factor [Gaiellales bacterium]